MPQDTEYLCVTFLCGTAVSAAVLLTGAVRESSRRLRGALGTVLPRVSTAGAPSVGASQFSAAPPPSIAPSIPALKPPTPPSGPTAPQPNPINSGIGGTADVYGRSAGQLEAPGPAGHSVPGGTLRRPGPARPADLMQAAIICGVIRSAVCADGRSRFTVTIRAPSNCPAARGGGHTARDGPTSHTLAGERRTAPHLAAERYCGDPGVVAAIECSILPQTLQTPAAGTLRTTGTGQNAEYIVMCMALNTYTCSSPEYIRIGQGCTSCSLHYGALIPKQAQL